jgi:Mg2+/Co2+ transporter CorB
MNTSGSTRCGRGIAARLSEAIACAKSNELGIFFSHSPPLLLVIQRFGSLFLRVVNGNLNQAKNLSQKKEKKETKPTLVHTKPFSLPTYQIAKGP